jgi:hypothetical protein
MSKVYSFRLNEDNPREAQAIEVINAWVSHGYSLRQILTESLLNYKETNKITNGWDHLYGQLSALIEKLESGGLEEPQEKNKTILSPFFLDAMKKSAKKGLKIK